LVAVKFFIDQALLEVRLAQRFNDKDELTRFQRRE